MTNKITLYTDASYRSKTGDGSYCYVILLDQNIFKILGKTTKFVKTNCLEICGIKYALYSVLNEFTDILNEVTEIELFTDSQNSINYINGKCNVHDENIKKVRDEILDILNTFVSNYPNIKINIQHVRGHHGNKLNEMVDKISQMISEHNKLISLKNN